MSSPSTQSGDRLAPLPDDPPPRFRPPRRLLAVLASFALVTVGFAYDFVVLANEQPTLPGWDVSRFDWVMLACLVTVTWLLVVPLLSDRERTAWYWQRLRRKPTATLAAGYLAVFVVVATLGPILVGDQIANLYNQYQPPIFTSVREEVVGKCLGPVVDGACTGTATFPLGTNVLGLGVLYLVVKGARVTFLVALVAGSLVAPIAAGVGVVAGYVGGTLDGVLMRYVDLQESIPAFLVYIIAAFFLGKSLLLLLAVFGLLSWGGVARLVRSETLQRRDAGYVRAALAAGASPLFVIRRHILPNVTSTLVTATTQLIPGLLLAEIALGYLRLNDEVVRSWGWTISLGLSGHHGEFPAVFSIIPPSSINPPLVEKWAPATFTVVAAVLTITAFAVLGDALRDVLDPRSR